MKNSLTLIYILLIYFVTSCSTTNLTKENLYKLDIDISTTEKNKEIFINSLLNKNINFNINFESNDGIFFENELLNSKVRYFCNSFIREQRSYIEEKILNNKNEKVLVVFSERNQSLANNLKKKYPNHIYTLISKDNYTNDISNVLNIDYSNNRFKIISSLDKNIKINHIPRVRQDISKIYFIVNYDFGKTIVPIFRSYSLKIDFYATSEIFHNAVDIKKLSDFEGTYIPLSNKLLEKISHKSSLKNLKTKIEYIIIEDYIELEIIYQNNLIRKNNGLILTPEKIERNKCISLKNDFIKIASV